MSRPTKLCLGCGHQHQHEGGGWLNIDAWSGCKPDVVWNLNETPWCGSFAPAARSGSGQTIGVVPIAIETSSIELVLMNHVFEHLQSVERTMVELHRVCKNGAEIYINVPHHMSDDQWNDPTHVRPVTVEMMCLFSKASCKMFRETGAANTPLADIHDVDFELASFQYVPATEYAAMVNDPGFATMANLNRNVIRELRMVLKVVKGEN